VISILQMSSIFAMLQALLLLYAAITDITARLIPNHVCLIVATLGIIGRLFVDPPQLAESFVVAAILFFLLLLLHRRGCIGGGDVKLVVALAIGLTFVQLVELLTITALAGGVLASMHLVMRRLPRPGLPPVGSSLPRRVYAVERWRNIRHAPLPYGVAIACGGIWTVLNHGV
jgi:prepilin peptidase CpaA